jgi:hypothetical protein
MTPDSLSSAPSARAPRHHRVRSVVLSVIALHAAAGSLTAQVLRVTLRDEANGVPIVGALVAALDSTDVVRREALSGADGVATLPLGTPATVRVRVRRIGFAPIVSAPVTVAAGTTVPLALPIAARRVTLARVTVRSRSPVCGTAPDLSDPTGQLFDRVMLAFRATELSRDRNLSFAVTEFSRMLDPAAREVAGTWRRNAIGLGRPFQALDPEKLATEGYITQEADGSLMYAAPDDRVWLSPSFTRTHCFSADGLDSATGTARLRFTPDDNRSVARISGTVYVDTLTEEPRRLTFTFIAPPALLPLRAPEMGGDVALTKLPGGEWIVSRWTLRLPILAAGGNERQATVGSDAGRGRVVLLGYSESGGTASPLIGRRPAGADSTPAPGLATLLVTNARNQPLRAAIISMDGLGVVAVTDAAGRARVWRNASDARTLEVRHPATYLARVTLAGGTTDTSVAVRMDALERTAERLQPDADTRLQNVGFRGRRGRASGTFVEMTAADAGDTTSALRLFAAVPGVTLVPLDGELAATAGALMFAAPFDSTVRVAVVRTPAPSVTTCVPQVFIDGELAGAGVLAQLRRSDLLGAEFYARGAFVPPDFRRSPPACGAALLWRRASVP